MMDDWAWLICLLVVLVWVVGVLWVNARDYRRSGSRSMGVLHARIDDLTVPPRRPTVRPDSTYEMNPEAAGLYEDEP